jgi:hypothetical protein
MKWMHALALLGLAGRALADEPTLLPHPDDTRWWLSGQLNVIAQAHPSFPSPYSGPNSLSAPVDSAVSFVATVYGGYRLTDTTELLLDVESAGGAGIGQALGLAGFTNLDVVRNPTLGAAPYVARAEVHQIIPLGDETAPATRGPFALAPRLPVRRLEIRAGKMSTVDVFDQNGPGSDSHLQFMNWTTDENGAYDYAADTRGYTLGVTVEYDDAAFAVRLGVLLMPTVANGIDYDFDLAHARGQNLEVEARPTDRLTLRFLGYLNDAAMGSYDEAIAAFRNGTDAVPDITKHRARGRTKAGVGVSFEDDVASGFRLFGRAGWNDGQNESFAYTEVDDTLELGGDWRGGMHQIGLAGVSNGLSGPHREYLALGGTGFLLGDGRLSYGREWILEAYWRALVWRGVSPAVDVQLVANPGYNGDRGPVAVFALRLHLDI